MHDKPPAEAPFPNSSNSLFEVVGLHFVIGSGSSTLIAALLILWRKTSNYPLTLACGGTFVVVIQWSLLVLPAIFRRFICRRILIERSPRATVLAGFLGSAMVFALPIMLDNFNGDSQSSIFAVLIPLVIYPLFASFFIFRRVM
jgi:hypothetical protein